MGIRRAKENRLENAIKEQETGYPRVSIWGVCASFDKSYRYTHAHLQAQTCC